MAGRRRAGRVRILTTGRQQGRLRDLLARNGLTPSTGGGQSFDAAELPLCKP
jgi:hypothetical protein